MNMVETHIWKMPHKISINKYIRKRLMHVDVWQKPTQYCKAIILQLKINLKKNHGKDISNTPHWRNCVQNVVVCAS